MYEIKPRLVGSCAIVVGDVEFTPVASHLFALLLAFALVPREPWTRRRLQSLLFADADERQAAHRLRQLLYRLRSFGVVLQESSAGSIRLGNPVADPLGDTDDGPDTPAHGLSVAEPLSLYTPRLPAAYLEWLEQRRDVLRSLRTARRMAWLRAARERQDWGACARLVAELLPGEALNDEVIVAGAEAYAMLGQRDRALDIIDQFVRDGGEPLDASPSLKRLRARILSTRIPRREGTLRGREECLAFLQEQWERSVAGGGGRVCAIFGPPGMGKTRVGETFSATVRLVGGQVVQHRCDGQARECPLGLFSQLVPDLRRRRGSLGANPALSAVLDHLAPGPVAPPADIGSPETRREEVRRAIIDLIEAVSAEQPLLLVVDDAHLLDDASRAVVRGVVESSNAAQVLLLLLCRPRPDTHSLLSPSVRFASHTLTPLSDDDSRALVLELSTYRPPTDQELAWAVTQAAGNAFYLHALAHNPSDNVSLPAHVTSLAQSSYLGVSPEARTVLEACLLLDTLATPARVAQVAGIERGALIAAVRELEASDLLRYHDGLFVGPHAIVRDVLEGLIPSTSRALLLHRVAELLSAECADPVRARAVGWAAVSAWLACGEPVAAVELALRVARQAAQLGEPEAGASLLLRLPQPVLSYDVRRRVLDDLIELSEAGKCLAMLSQSLRDRMSLAVRANEDRSTIAKIANRLASSEHIAGLPPDLKHLTNIAGDVSIDVSVRAQAISRLLVNADMTFDREQAENANRTLMSLRSDRSNSDPSFLRAAIVYHCSFGSSAEALTLIRELINAAPILSIEPESRGSHSYAAFALLRLGLYYESIQICENALECMRRHSHLVATEYFGGLAAEAYIGLGDFSSAERMLNEIRVAAAGRTSREDSPISGIHSLEVLLGIASGDHVRAQRAFVEARRVFRPLSARLRAVALSHKLRIAQIRGGDQPTQARDELLSLFARGKHLGGQDTVAEALWHSHVLSGHAEAASQLLGDFLSTRRELGFPDAMLRATTASDPAWIGFGPGHRPGLITTEPYRSFDTR